MKDDATPAEVRFTAELGPMPAHWYAVAKDGRATLCVDEEDARQAAAEYDLSWPNGAPHRAVLMGDVKELRMRWRGLALAFERLDDLGYIGSFDEEGDAACDHWRGIARQMLEEIRGPNAAGKAPAR